MSYKINKYANKEQFIVDYNHRQGLQIQDGAELVEGVYTEFTYALLPNEIMFQEEVEIEVDVLDYETKIEEYEEPIFNEFGEIIGNETKTQEVQVPIMITVEEVAVVPIFDEEGNFIGEEEQNITKEVQQTHKEKKIVTLNYPIVNPNYEEEQKQKEKERIAMLKLTRGDVFRGLLQAKGITRSYIREMIEQLPVNTTEENFKKEMALIDFDEALDFYRGNQLINTIGFQLGIKSEQLDNFFRYNDYKFLLNEQEV